MLRIQHSQQLADDVDFEITGETGAAGEYTEDQVNLMLALAQGKMHAGLLAAKLGISEEDLAVLVRDTDCVSSMMKDDVIKKKDKGSKKRKLLKSIVYELMGNALKLATDEKERCTWVASKHGGDFLADGSP